ncbi:MAG: nitroreductase family protein [Candidatus Ornithomonoglobus sp.]
MELIEAIKNRHSVRSYDERKIEGDVKKELLGFIEQCNRESGLHMQLVLDEPKAFGGFMAHYGKFSGVKNYIALIGKKGSDLDEKCGYYGEKVVLKAQQLGLNTCWVALTYSKIKTAFQIDNGEKLCVVIAVGYGTTQGTAHRSKPIDSVINTADGASPAWFKAGTEAALLAPTAMNQQKFTFALNGNKVSAKAGAGFYSRLDLGIVKYHFEIGAGTENFRWE